MGPDVVLLRQAAERYCRLVESTVENGLGDLIAPISEALLELALIVQRLPEIECDCGDDQTERIAHGESQGLLAALRGRLGDRDLYRVVFDPTDADDRDPVVSSLADDLTDIYRDLADGLALWEAGRQTDAAWEWQFGYWSHWGRHLVNAARMLYFWQAEDR